MLNHRQVQRIGKQAIAISVVLVRTVLAADVQFSAEVDQTKISQDETLTLNLMVKTKNSFRMREPEFDAPDFAVVNSFSSMSMTSQYDENSNGFSTVNSQQVTKVLKPLKSGTLKITGIKIQSQGKVLTAPDIVVQVGSEGGQSQKSPSFHRPHLSNQKEAKDQAWVSAEVNRSTVFKGEQLIINYYLYHRSRIFNVQVEKFPVLNGFLREDLDIPAMGNQINSEPVVVNGANYQRALLAKYAAYPLQEGKLSLDFISIKYGYYSNPSANPYGIDEESPLFGFFQQITPRVGTSKSESLNIQVLPLPEQGKPANWSGGVGSFSVSSAMDKHEVRANEAVTVTVKVEGKGNVAAVAQPKINWPAPIELYDAKGKSQPGRNGSGFKVFEFLLIPRSSGKWELPAIEFSFFDPQLKQYYSKKTEPLALHVLEAAAGSSSVVNSSKTEQTQGNPLPPGEGKATQAVAQKAQVEDLRYLKSPEASPSGFPWSGVQVGIRSLVVLVGFAWLALFLQDLLGKGVFGLRKRRTQGATHDLVPLHRLKVLAKAEAVSASDITQAYEDIGELTLNWLENRYHFSVKTVPREQWQEILVGEKNMPEASWKRITAILEFTDLIRFAGKAGAVPESRARSELGQWIHELESVLTQDQKE